jgi:Flp pilus assembly protein TadB
MNQYSELTHRKIKLYFAANYLFSQGKSHPQAIEILSEYEPDPQLLESMVDAAMTDHWRTIFNEVQRLTSQGKTYHEIFEEVKTLEADEEIVHLICNVWYRVQTLYMENTVESGANISEGIQWVIISAIGLVVVFCFNWSVFSKVIWGLAFVAALITWLYGLRQKKEAARLKRILETDYVHFTELI